MSLHCAEADFLIFFSPSTPFTCLPGLNFTPMMFVFANTAEWAGWKGGCCPSHGFVFWASPAVCTLHLLHWYLSLDPVPFSALCRAAGAWGAWREFNNCVSVGKVPVLLSMKWAPAVSIQNHILWGFYLLPAGKNNNKNKLQKSASLNLVALGGQVPYTLLTRALEMYFLQLCVTLSTYTECPK